VRVQAVAVFAPTGVDASTDALLEFPSGAVASVDGSLRASFEQGLVISGERGRIVLDRPFVPAWDATEIVVECDDAREIHPIGGANHFLHMVEHFEALVRDPSRSPDPAEDGVANVEACALVQHACRVRHP
jgi:hypothetical protein